VSVWECKYDAGAGAALQCNATYVRTRTRLRRVGHPPSAARSSRTCAATRSQSATRHLATGLPVYSFLTAQSCRPAALSRATARRARCTPSAAAPSPVPQRPRSAPCSHTPPFIGARNRVRQRRAMPARTSTHACRRRAGACACPPVQAPPHLVLRSPSPARPARKSKRHPPEHKRPRRPHAPARPPIYHMRSQPATTPQPFRLDQPRPVPLPRPPPARSAPRAHTAPPHARSPARGRPAKSLQARHR
jgi:hypothetical protein